MTESYELDRIITLKEAADLMGVSVQTVRRTYRDKFIRLSPRRLGMRLRDVLLLGSNWEASSSNLVDIRGHDRPKV